MKYLLLIAVVLMVVWLLRGKRRAGSGNAEPPPGAAVQQQEMIRCPVCSVHVPRTDALPGPDGQLYCCAEHRLRGKA